MDRLERLGLAKNGKLINESKPDRLERRGLAKNGRLINEQEEEPANEESFLSKLPRNVTAGLANLGHGLLNTPYNLTRATENQTQKIGQLFNKLPGSEYTAKRKVNLAESIPHQQNYDYAKLLGQKGEGTFADKLIQGLTQYLPALALPGANLGKVAEGAEAVAPVSNFLREATEQAIPQAAFGATQTENPGQGISEGAIGSVIGTGIGKALEKGINKLKPSNLITSPLNKKELVKAYQNAKGTTADLGNIIENPKLQRLFENQLPKLTGLAYDVQQNTGKQVTERGEKLLKSLLGKNNPDTVPEKISDIVTKQFKDHETFKGKLYDHVDKIADESNLNLSLPNFSNEAKKYLDAIEDTSFLKHEPDAKIIWNKLTNYKNPVKETTTVGKILDTKGNPILKETKIEYPTLKEANILKGKLNRYSRAYASSPNPDQRNIATILGNLARALKTDIGTSIKDSGNIALKSAYKKAEENYAKNFSPFLDKDVYKFVSGNADPQTIISKFLTTSNVNDLSNKLGKLSTKLGNQQGLQGQNNRNLLAYGYLSRAIDKEGNLNPAKLATAIKKLGKKQFETLFPDKQIRTKLLDYASLVSKNKESLNVLFNPKTGQRGGDINVHALTNLIGGGLGLATHGISGGLIGSLAAPLITKGLARKATKALTSEDLRRKIIKALVNKKETSLPKTKQALSKIGAVSGLASGNEEHKPLELELIKRKRKE